MMIMNRLGVSTLAALLFLPAAALAVDPDPNPGGTVHVLSYFISTWSGCTSPMLIDKSLAFQARSATAGEQCPNVGPMFFTLEGAEPRRWATGTFFSDGGWLNGSWVQWLKETEEWSYNNMDPNDPKNTNRYPIGVIESRTFRDHATGRKGLKWIPLTIPAIGDTFWYDDPTDGDLFNNHLYGGVCYGVPMQERNAAPVWYGNAYTVKLPGWITNVRGVPQSPPLDVYTVVKDGTFTGDRGATWETERYYYGKVVMGGQWYGLGLVKFEWEKSDGTSNFRGDSLSNPHYDPNHELHFLVDCNVGLQCNSCPDP
jgi:hypothetical protein